MELKFRRRCVTHTDKYNHFFIYFLFFLLWYNFIVAYVLSRCCDITSGKADTFSWLYNVNVLTERMFPSGQTLKVGKSILLKSLLDDILFIPKDEAWPLVFFFLLVWNHRENHTVLWLLLYVKLRNWSCPHLFFLRRLRESNLVSSFESKLQKVSHQVKWASDSSLAPVCSVLNQKRLAYLAFG